MDQSHFFQLWKNCKHEQMRAELLLTKLDMEIPQKDANEI